MSLHEFIKSEDDRNLLSSHITPTNSSPPFYNQHQHEQQQPLSQAFSKLSLTSSDTPSVSLGPQARTPVTFFVGTDPKNQLTSRHDGRCEIIGIAVEYGSEEEVDDKEEEEEGEMTIIDISGGNDHIPEGLSDDHTYGLLEAIALRLRSQRRRSYRGVNLGSTLSSSGVSKSRLRSHPSCKSSGSSYEEISLRAHTDLDTIEEEDPRTIEVENYPFDSLQSDH
ncbi:hypothetical protein V865_005710 [Kwoniella europaea PYCC6329]|uniref:Uncharacterized protein n=1 Tax=Kwoniella europaea PYCC6329 TaxID=1423913 RepID=A0AAX4KN75_9TREE